MNESDDCPSITVSSIAYVLNGKLSSRGFHDEEQMILNYNNTCKALNAFDSKLK